jgi:hypothetical protein
MSTFGLCPNRAYIICIIRRTNCRVVRRVSNEIRGVQSEVGRDLQHDLGYDPDVAGLA